MGMRHAIYFQLSEQPSVLDPLQSLERDVDELPCPRCGVASKYERVVTRSPTILTLEAPPASHVRDSPLFQQCVRYYPEEHGFFNNERYRLVAIARFLRRHYTILFKSGAGPWWYTYNDLMDGGGAQITPSRFPTRNRDGSWAVLGLLFKVEYSKERQGSQRRTN